MRLPRATYRLQLRDGVGFAEARAAVPYLDRLGVSHLYASPLLAARSGSTHGYDVTDPTRLDPALGPRATFDALTDDLAARGMGLVLDIVPNHMAASVENPWWRDVLARGRESRWARVFDVDWDAPGLGGRLLLPLLGQPLEAALAAGEVAVEPPVVRLGELELPMAEGTTRLDEQRYVLAPWRVANERLNFRRFFDITDLVGVRASDPWVFEQTHRLVLDLVAEGRVQGLRIDHVDGLHDPLGYLRRLREAVGPDVPVWVEKILGADETLPASWPVQGTTGYELAAAALDSLLDPEGAAAIERAYAAATGAPGDFAAVAERAKREALELLLATDVDRVARALAGPLDRSPEELHPALVEAAVALPVYRTYVRADGAGVADRARLDAAVPDTELRAALLGEVPGATEGALRFAQLTGPAAAKGVEDTALYRHVALLARNEVGAHPGVAPWGAGEFHELAAAQAADWPGLLTAAATHDSKRGPDVRARLAVLTEIPEDWAAAVDLWTRLEAAGRPAGAEAPDPNAAWLVWQTLVGAWPLDREREAGFAERVHAYVEKAAREAKTGTSWTAPDAAYEDALHDLVERALDPAGALRATLAAFAERIAWPGAINGLSLALLLLAGPGVPDTYQGSEGWALTLVDPDNRAPVDGAELERRLADAEVATPAELVAGWRDGRLKALVVHRALEARRRDPELFLRGGYRALDAGPEVLAFARELDGRWAVCAVPRDPLRHTPAERPLALPGDAPGSWVDALTAAPVPGARVFGALPVSLLVGSSQLDA
jgi:malto-oligosyltrehalose synthase